MKFSVAKSDYIGGFRKALKQFPDFPAVFIHTDLLQIGAVDHAGSKEEMCQGHLDVLQEIFEGRPLIFPTFNYDFYQTRVFDVPNDPSQIGALNEFIRRRYPDQRTLTPVFSHVLVNEHDFDMGFFSDPFGQGTLYDQGVKRGCLMCMLGPGLSSSTFQHYVEVHQNVPYRYWKPFNGQVKTSKETFDVLYRPYVLPMNPEARALIRPDIERLQQLVTDAGYATTFPLGRGEVLIYSMAGYNEVLSTVDNKNPLRALTPDSQRDVTAYLEKIGGRMTIENMEPGWTPDRKADPE